jgi:predicted Zn-dependent peptidase
MSIQQTTLPSGLRIITDTVDAVDSVAVGLWADAGTRHEDMAENGIAHLVEHMMFKGTPTRSALDIVEAIEDVGGQVNAWTSRDMTSYHVHLLKEDLPMALDILADLIQNPAMPEDELEKERQVVLQEIGMSIDTPDDLVFDLYQETAYPDQTLGAPILGRSPIVSSVPRDALLSYVKRFYTPSRLVLSAAGNVKHDDMVKQAERLFSTLPQDNHKPFAPAAYKGGEKRETKKLEQSHVVLGFKGLAKDDEDLTAATAMSVLFGGGMSSRLFQEIREKRGLVYSIFGYHTAWRDDGQFLIYAGTGPERLGELVPVLCDEIKLLLKDGVRDEEVTRAKAQMRSGLLMGRESMMNRADRQAKHLIHHGKVIDMAERLQKIEAVTAQAVRRSAERIFSATPTLAALGPLENLMDYATIKGRLAH